jgi:hypothetical protein
LPNNPIKDKYTFKKENAYIEKEPKRVDFGFMGKTNMPEAAFIFLFAY